MGPPSLYKQALLRFRKATEDRYRDGKDREILDEFLRQRASPEETRDAAESLAADAGKKWGSKKMGDIEIPASWIANIMGNINNFVSAGNVMMEGAPETAGYAWFAVKLTLSAIQANYELYTFFGSGLTDISEIMIIVRHYDRLYDERAKPDWKASPLVDKLFDDVIAAYTAVLDFSFAIKRHLTAGTLTRIKHGFKDFFGGSKAKFEGKLAAVAELKRKIIEESQGAFQDKTLSQLESVSSVLGDINTTVVSIQSFQKTQEEWHAQSMARLDALLKGIEDIKAATKPKTPWDWAYQDFQRHNTSLKPIGNTDVVLGVLIDTRHPDTCTWIFERDEFVSWEESSNQHKMLSVTGQEGTGKSIMLASIFEHLDDKNDGRTILYLSCGAATNTAVSGSKITYTADSICYTFLSKLYVQAAQDPENPRLLEACNEVFANPKARKGGRAAGGKAGVDLPEFADAFSRIAAQLKQNVVIVLDGIDDAVVDENDQEELFGRLTELIETKHTADSDGVRIQVLVGCGSSSGFSNRLSPGSYIDMTDSNKSDIETTLAAALDGVRGLTSAEQEEARAAILTKTGYSFAYLSTVAIPFIREPFQRPLSRRLEALPGGINDTYTNALQKMSPNYVDLLRTTLTWSLLQTQGRPLKAGEIMDIFQGAYDVAPDSEQLEGVTKPGFPTPSRLEIEQLRGASGPFFTVEQDALVGDDYWVIVRDQGRIEEFCLDRPASDHVQKHQENEELCGRCQSAISESNTLSVNSKEGHLQIALACLRHLNHPFFQKRAGLLEKRTPKPDVNGMSPDAKESADALATSEEGKDAGEESIETKSKNDEPPYTVPEPDYDSEDEEDVTGMVDLEEQGEDHEDDPDLADDDYDVFAYLDVRYEIQFWASHLREAEALWPPGERENHPTWAAVMAELDKFTTDNPNVFFNWQQKYFEAPAFFRRMGASLNPLYAASHLGLESWTKHLLGRGADPNEPCSEMLTALTAASQKSTSRTVLRLLLEKGGNINAGMETRVPPFHTWLWKDPSLESVELMLKHGADAKATNNYGWSAIHYFASRGTDPKVLDLLLQHGVDINAKDKASDTPLHMLLGRREVPLGLLEAFIANKADVNVDNMMSIRPLQMASLYGELDSLRVIIKAAVTELDDLDFMGDTALHEAACGGHAETVRLLLESGADPTIANTGGETALHCAAEKGSSDCVKVFLEYSESPDAKCALNINAADGHNRTPFFKACQSKTEGTALMLLEALIKHGLPLAEINKMTSTSRTPLRQAASRGYHAIVKMLMDLASSPSDPALGLDTADTKKLQTPLHRAAWHGHLETVKHLLSLKPNPSLPDEKGCTPLSLAVSLWAVASDNSAYEDIIALLIAADPTAAGGESELAATCAANGSVRLLRQLQPLMHDLNVRDRFGWTPLELARKFSRKAVVDFLTAESAWRGLLPSRWASEWPFTTPAGARSVLESGVDIFHVTGDRVCVSGDRPLPAELDRYYFEVTLGDVALRSNGEHEQGQYPEVAVGFCTIGGGVVAFPGWTPKSVAPAALSWGYHADDGGVYSSKGDGALDLRRRYGPGDTVGCGVDLKTGDIWWTLNGTKVDQTFGKVEGRLFPLVGLHDKVFLETNFGTKPFLWKEWHAEEELAVNGEQAVIKVEVASVEVAKTGDIKASTETIVREMEVLTV